MTDVPGSLGAMGKLPGWDEYVTINAQSPLFGAFDRWVAEGMDAAQSTAGWSEHYLEGAVQAFVFAPLTEGPFLAGALSPSVDRAGRKYPLFAGRQVEAEAISSLETLPLSLEDLWDDAGRIVTHAKEDGTVAVLQALLDEEPSAPSSDFPDALEGWRAWTSGMHLEELSELLFEAADSVPLGGALRALLEATAPHRGVTPRRTRLSLRLPLGKAGGAVVCFWLAVVERALAWKSVVPSLFWTHDGESGSLLLHLGVPWRGTIGQIWMPAPADEVLDLLDPAAPSYRTEFRHTGVEAVLAREDAKILDLLNAL